MLSYETSPLMKQMADAAVRVSITTKFPPAVFLAMSACESAWWTRVTGSWNYYGITADPADIPDRATFCATHEDVTPEQLAGFREDERATAVQGPALGGGKYRYQMHRWFTSYESLDESVEAFVNFFILSPGRYKPAWQQFAADGDEDALLKGICAAGYATGDAETVEITIEHQGNIVHAVEMAAAAQKVIT